MKHLGTLCFVLCFVACSSPSAESTLRKHYECFNKKDVDCVLSTVTTEGMSMFGSGPIEAKENLLINMSQVKNVTIDIDKQGGNDMIAEFEVTQRFYRNKGGMNKRRLKLIFTKDSNGEWKISDSQNLQTYPDGMATPADEKN